MWGRWVEGGREESGVNGISLQRLQDQHENGLFTTPRIVYVHTDPLRTAFKIAFIIVCMLLAMQI